MVRLDAVPFSGVLGAVGLEVLVGAVVAAVVEAGGWHAPGAQCHTATTGAGMLTW